MNQTDENGRHVDTGITPIRSLYNEDSVPIMGTSYVTIPLSMSASSLPAALEKLVKRFQKAASNKQRYEQLLWLANKLDALPAEAKVAENKVPGCVSNVYIEAELQDGKVKFLGDSDSQLTKGLVAFLIRGLDGLTPEEILPIEPDFIQDTGLKVSLTPSRANGFYNIFKTMKAKASALMAETAP